MCEPLRTNSNIRMTSWTRLSMFCRANICRRCVRTVARLSSKADAICLSQFPCKISSTMSACRGEKRIVSTTRFHSSVFKGPTSFSFLTVPLFLPPRGIAEIPKKRASNQGRPRTPGKGFTERALADAPFGARLQGTASVNENLPVSLEQRLDARASNQIVVVTA